MPHDTSKPPEYRKHTDRNLAVVTLCDAFTKKRRSYYLGKHSTPASREKSHRRLADAQSPSEPCAKSPSSLSVEAIS
jgi:hypothetical protein